MMALRVQEGRYRRGVIHLGPDAKHSLAMEFGAIGLTLDRSEVRDLAETLDRVLYAVELGVLETEDALRLIRTFRPEFLLADLPVLRSWLGAFEEEMVVEDRRDEPRIFKAGKVLKP